MSKHIHGGNVYTHTGCLDYSANCNPLGTPENVIAAAKEALDHVQDYPQVGYEPLRKAIAEYEGVLPEHVICGNGAAEIIYTLCQAVKPKKALLPAPTFAEYEQALTGAGCEVEYFYLKEEEDFLLQESFIEKLNKDLDIVFLCNPNNPTGALIDREFLFRVLRNCRDLGILLVVDECFLDFVKAPEKYTLKAQLSRYHNLFLLKAFTKRYAMAGIRLGYGLTENQELLEKMAGCVQPWNLSVIAQAAGLAALEAGDQAEQGRQIVFEEVPYLENYMKELDLKVWPTAANYIFFKGPKGLVETMIRHGILIRDCGNYTGLSEGFYRVAVRTHEENKKMTAALRDSLIEIFESKES